MKTLVTFLLFCTLAVAAQDITSKVSERRNPDGTLRWRIETTSRGKTPILRVHQKYGEPAKADTTYGEPVNGQKATVARSYMVGGEMVMMEVTRTGTLCSRRRLFIKHRRRTWRCLPGGVMARRVR